MVKTSVKLTKVDNSEGKVERDDADYVPTHLRPYVFHSQDDFYVSRSFDALLVAHLMYEGFLPIATKYRSQYILLPKLHRERCILLLDAAPHIPKSVKKKSKKYILSLNQDFDGVVAGCHAQHGEAWLYPPIVDAFRKLSDAKMNGYELYKDCRIRFFTIEIRDAASNALVAGELGYTAGQVYTSLTGFSNASGAGTIQLHALSRLLYRCGFKMWDLGMSMPYKQSLGASDVERDVFLSHLHEHRTTDLLLDLPTTSGTCMNTKTLLELNE